MNWEYARETGVWWFGGIRYSIEHRSEGQGSAGTWLVCSPTAAHEARIRWNIGQGNDAQSKALTLAKSVAELLNGGVE